MKIKHLLRTGHFSLQASKEESDETEGDNVEVFDFLRGITTDILQRFS